MNKAERIAELKAEIARLEAERRPSARPKPTLGVYYWEVTARGTHQRRIWEGSEADHRRYAQGNVFKTEAEAQAHAEHLEAVTACNDAAMRSWVDVGDVLDWKNGSQNKWFIYFSHLSGKYEVLCAGGRQIQAAQFATEAAAHDFINTYDKTHRLFWQYGDV